jgi:signal transduction histidine kinase
LQGLIKELEVERKRFRDILDIVPAYIVLIEIADFSIYYSNNFFRERYSKACGKTCHELIYGRTKVCENCGILNIFSLQYPFYGEMTDPNGRIYQIIRFPFNNEEGKSLIFEMGTDVTEKRNLEKIIQTRINEAEEKERKRIASDLHDDLGPTLCSVKLQLSSFKNKIDNNLLNDCVQLLTDSIEKMRTLANNISPNLVEMHGLETAVMSFIDKIEQTHQIHFNIKSNIKGSRFNNEAEVHLYRIITELVKNSISHSNCNEVNIKLHLNGDAFSMIYFDNGIGYEIQEKPSPDSGIGLQNIRTRVKLLNGTIEFKKNDKYTVVEINIRLPNS